MPKNKKQEGPKPGKGIPKHGDLQRELRQSLDTQIGQYRDKVAAGLARAEAGRKDYRGNRGRRIK